MQEMMSDIQAGLQSYAQRSGEHKARESANVPEYICGVNDHFFRSLRDRYEIIYD